jgi:hypothetical protein
VPRLPRPPLCAALLVLVALLALPAAASARAVHFTTPSTNIDCRGEGASISCLVEVASWPRLPPRPANCDVDWIPTQITLSSGRVSLGSCRGDIGPLCLPSGPDSCTVLRYGRSLVLKRNGIRCTSRRTGLTCRTRNGTGAGFKVAREGYRIFR